ncbi:hypothetical protein GCM10010435_18960 [Winogradskya consettensis]|uniref:Uncharacterized protein n=1 Tax=Winogradskya consettensis TaxID=113560 RepID=A0A919SVQ3_9ACTN|nr:hypothetical protein [Actinoplanes consettensis]GIM78366.1 hypothetical protein Aco04nite_60090 [Actinoplanes consettensis]
MSGDAPQPGQTPRHEGEPWTWTDRGTGTWWSGDLGPQETTRSRSRRGAAETLEAPKQAEHTGEAATAHEAGMQDTTTALTGEAPTERAALKPAPARKRDRARKTERTEGVEQAHDQVGNERFNPQGTSTAYTSKPVPEAAPIDPDHEPTIVDLLAALPLNDPIQPLLTQPPLTQPPISQPPVGRSPGARTGGPMTLEGETVAPGVPEELTVPEQDRNRPTVALPKPPARSRLGRAREDRARADRALQDRVRAERTAALLETSPFWRTEEERAANAAWPPAETREKLGAGRPPKRPPRDPRHPVGGLVALLALGLVAAFFSWVSAEPFWLAVGHGREGTATVSQCTGSGVTQRCTGSFTAANGSYKAENIALLGVKAGQRTVGSVGQARMVSMTSRQAYVGETSLLVHLRWTLAFVLVMLCGLGIAALTGARRLETAQARRGAVLLSLTGPLLLLAGFLIATY